MCLLWPASGSCLPTLFFHPGSQGPCTLSLTPSSLNSLLSGSLTRSPPSSQLCPHSLPRITFPKWPISLSIPHEGLC